ncbi:hypothetical protein NJT12_08500 [Flavobacterium sp. AC]|uniref:Lipoprotein n=1 Tax=Flavobacterium azizsancarii TaxID=2961580 RepID=A0ABT4WAV6_9FLAO|nr:hypothetical protein [Flavobacterium azizsancarii]MDA6069658.1 hypothetical protein [Flavobacterium azizsancarii]
MKQLMLSLLVLILFSCKKNEETSDSKISNKKEKDSSERENDGIKKLDTLKISYYEHKNLFDILTILPDSTMASWRWNKNERIEFVKQIQKLSYTTTPAEHFSKISLTQPNTIEIQVVDGYWVLSIYKIKTNNYIVITNDVVGDGKDLHAYEYLNGELKYIPFKSLFDNLTAFLIDKNDKNCMEFLEDNQILFDYNFIGTKKIQISDSDLLEDSKDCFKGNILNYEFNPELKKFNLINIE